MPDVRVWGWSVVVWSRELWKHFWQAVPRKNALHQLTSLLLSDSRLPSSRRKPQRLLAIYHLLCKPAGQSQFLWCEFVKWGIGNFQQWCRSNFVESVISHSIFLMLLQKAWRLFHISYFRHSTLERKIRCQVCSIFVSKSFTCEPWVHIHVLKLKKKTNKKIQTTKQTQNPLQNQKIL